MGHEMTRECQCYIWFWSTDTSKETGNIRQRTGHRAASSESPVSHRSVSGKVTSQPLDHGQDSGAEMMSLSQAPGGRCWRCGMAGTRVAVVLQTRAGWLQAQQAEQMPKDMLKHSPEPCYSAANWKNRKGPSEISINDGVTLFAEKGRVAIRLKSREQTPANESWACKGDEFVLTSRHI